jgi:hypothetical protein
MIDPCKYSQLFQANRDWLKSFDFGTILRLLLHQFLSRLHGRREEQLKKHVEDFQYVVLPPRRMTQ